MGAKSPESLDFHVEITWTGGKEGTIVPEGKPALPLTSPLYWDGKPQAYSPHDLFLSAISGCYITTFASMMKRMKQPIHAHKVSGKGQLQKHPEGGWLFTDVFITMEITVPKEANLSQVNRAIELTEKYCHISRSISCEVHLEAKVQQLD
jgi:organic hydroperoxide reductase OsmC/OhrA